MPDSPQSPWKAMRWQYLDNVDGVGATGTGMVLSAPGQVFVLRAMAYTGTGRLHVYDHTNRPSNPLTVLCPEVGAPDVYPPVPAALQVRNGVYVSFSMGTGGIAVNVGWER